MTRLGAAQGLWRRGLPPALRRLAAPLATEALGVYVRIAARPHPATPETPPGPIRIVGLFDGASGISASANLAARAFETLGVPVERVPVSAGLDLSRRLAGPTASAAWVFHLNPPELEAAMASLGPSNVVGPRYGYWAWELPRAPSRWRRDGVLVDEIWAPSQYTAQALAGAAAPVRVVPHPMFGEDFKEAASAPRGSGFQAVSVFDFNSSLARKNPQGAIEAFSRAFGDDPACEFVIKTQNGAAFPELLAGLRLMAPANVRIVDETWPYAQVQSLIAGADVLISLHRSEGFGLTPAEALALGTPVLATAYSGVVDFLDESCALMVPFRLTPVRDSQGVYGGQSWADPDLEAAAAALRRLRDDPTLGERLAEAGHRRILERLSPKAWFASLPQSVQTAALTAKAG